MIFALKCVILAGEEEPLGKVVNHPWRMFWHTSTLTRYSFF